MPSTRYCILQCARSIEKTNSVIHLLLLLAVRTSFVDGLIKTFSDVVVAVVFIVSVLPPPFFSFTNSTSQLSVCVDCQLQEMLLLLLSNSLVKTDD